MDKILKTPIWVFHGGSDPYIPSKYPELIISELKRFGANNIKYTLIPHALHDSSVWEKVYNDKDLYDWFLQYKRNKN